MLAKLAFAPAIAGEKAAGPAPFAWEAEEVFPVSAPVSLWLARLDDFATGEGLTIHFAVAAARSEAEFRRRLARDRGADLADRAGAGCGIHNCVPFLPLFVTPALKAALAAFETSEGPATFSFFARLHAMRYVQKRSRA